MKPIYTPRRVVCAIAGALVIAVDASFNVVNQWEIVGTLNHPVVWGTLAAACATTIGSYAGFAALRERCLTDKFLGAVALIAMVLGMSYSFVQSIQLWTTVQHKYLAKLAEAEQVKRIKSSPYFVRIKEVEGEIARLSLRTQVKTECTDDLRMADGSMIRNVTYNPGVHPVEWFPKCQGALDSLARYENQIERFQALMHDVTRVEYWEVDEAAASLALGLPWSQENISLYRNWLLPMALLLFGISLFSWGMMGERPAEPEFSLALTGEAAAVDKAERFMVAFRQANGQWPSKAEISNVAGISPQRAETIRKRVMSRKRK